MNSPVVNFRADPALLDTLRARAVESGKSVSELIRVALREKVGALPTNAFNPFEQLRLAADGDLSAIRALADRGVDAVNEGDPVALAECLTFARMAAARGGVEDYGRLLALLQLGQDILADSPDWVEYHDMLAGEALATVSLLADAGVEIASDFLPAMADDTSAAGVANAQWMRPLMEAQ